MYVVLEAPFIFWCFPSLDFSDVYDVYVGGTRFITHWYGFLITIFGFFIALSRTRDKIVRAKICNIWY